MAVPSIKSITKYPGITPKTPLKAFTVLAAIPQGTGPPDNLYLLNGIITFPNLRLGILLKACCVLFLALLPINFSTLITSVFLPSYSQAYSHRWKTSSI